MAGCCGDLGREFTGKNLSFNCDTSYGIIAWKAAFGEGGGWWNTRWNYFMALRAFNALVMTTTLLASITEWEVTWQGIEYWFFYLTHWALFVQVVYLNLAVACTWILRPKGSAISPAEGASEASGPDGEMPVYVKVLWGLQGVIVPGSFVVFVLYWALVFSGTVYFISVLVHGVNFIVQMADFLASQQPYLLLHGVYFLGFAVLYLLWSAIHYGTGWGNGEGERYVYSSLDWSSPGSAAVLSVLILLVVVPGFSLLFWFLSYLCRSSPPVVGEMDTHTENVVVDVNAGALTPGGSQAEGS